MMGSEMGHYCMWQLSWLLTTTLTDVTETLFSWLLHATARFRPRIPRGTMRLLLVSVRAFELGQISATWIFDRIVLLAAERGARQMTGVKMLGPVWGPNFFSKKFWRPRKGLSFPHPPDSPPLLFFLRQCYPFRTACRENQNVLHLKFLDCVKSRSLRSKKFSEKNEVQKVRIFSEILSQNV